MYPTGVKRRCSSGSKTGQTSDDAVFRSAARAGVLFRGFDGRANGGGVNNEGMAR